MTSRRGPGVVAVLATALVLTSSLPTQAAVLPGPVTELTGGATVDVRATSVGQPLVEAVSVLQQVGELTPATRDLALQAAAAAGAPAAVGKSFTAFLLQARHQGSVIQSSLGPGWAFPLATTALPPAPVAAIWGRDMAALLGSGQIVMSQTSASLRGAQVGDVLSFVGIFGITTSLTIGRIVPDADIGGTELLMSITNAERLGQGADARVLIYGQFDHAQVDAQLAAVGLLGNPKIGVSHSWDPPTPDSTLSLAQTKALMGEFDFYWPLLKTSEWTSINPAWVAKYVPTKDVYARGIAARCNTVVKADLAAALAEVDATYPGLFNVRTGIDVANTNRYGGCSNNGEARFARNTTNISRHSWGQPIDMSTVANAQGAAPLMDCRIVRIFRKHNFAWGGNFLRPDGMHFEWVGTPRNSIQYPSRYCPNLANGQIESIVRPPVISGLGSLFAADGMSTE